MKFRRVLLPLGILAVAALIAAVLLWPKPGPATAGLAPPLFGDVNCDESVNSIDAALVLQLNAGLLSSLACADNADVNADGSINSIDAALILQYTAGLVSSLERPPILVLDKFGEGTVSTSPAGIVCDAGCTTDSSGFPAGRRVVLTAVADPGSVFSSWSGCDSVSANTCTVTVDADMTVLATFRLADVQVPATTKVLDESTMQHLIRQEGSTYYFDPVAEVTAALEPGDVIVSAVGDGLLRKVSAVDVSEQEIAVETTEATLEDAIERGTLVFSEEAGGLSGLQSSQVFTPAGSVSCVIRELRCTVPLNVDLGDGLTISGSTSFDIDLDIAASFDGLDLGCLCFPVREVRSVATFQVDTEMTVFAGAQFSLAEEITIPVATGTWVVFIGHVPVLLQLELAVNVGINGQAEAGIESQVSLQNTFTVGGHYVRGSGWSEIVNYDRTFSASDPEVTARGQVKAYVEPVLTGKVYAVPGPYFGVEGYLRLNVDPLETPWWSLYGGLGASAGLDTEVFGLTLVNYTLPLWEREWLLAQAPSGGTFATPEAAAAARFAQLAAGAHLPFSGLCDLVDPGDFASGVCFFEWLTFGSETYLVYSGGPYATDRGWWVGVELVDGGWRVYAWDGCTHGACTVLDPEGNIIYQDPS